MLRDLRYAIRGLVHRPGFTLIAIVTLALGIGANTAVFSVVHGVLLQPLPYPEADRLVRLRTQNPQTWYGLSVVDWQALTAESRSFSHLAAYFPQSVTWTGPQVEAAERLVANQVTADFFETLGVAPLLGRSFEPGEDRPEAEPTVVLSHRFWRDRLGADRDVPGRTLRLDGTDYRILGVLPPGAGPVERAATDVFPIARFGTPQRRGPFRLRVVGRLREGVDRAAAEAELAEIDRRLFPLWRESYQDESATWTALPLREQVVGDVGRALWVLFGAVALVLLLATVNVANLVLSRSAGRRRELAVRSALGASRGRLAWLFLSESLLLAVLGGGGGLGLAALGVRALVSAGPADLPRLTEISVDGTVLAFTTAVTLLTAVGFGLAPLFGRSAAGSASAAGSVGVDLLRGGSRSSGPHGRLLRGLVVAELALALPLVVGAGLLLRTLVELRTVDPGYDPEHLLTLQVSIPPDPEAEPAESLARLNAFWQDMIPRLEALPGVQAAGLNNGRPPHQLGDLNNFDLEARPTPPGRSQPTAPWMSVTRGYFEALELPLLEGRWFTPRPNEPGAPVELVVDRAWADRYFPEGSAVGQRLYSGGQTSGSRDVVVGVVGTVKYTGLDSPDPGTVYMPYEITGYRRMSLFLGTAQDPASLIPEVRRTFAERAPEVALSQIATGEELMADSLTRPRYLTTLLSVFALLALALAVVGVYGVMAYLVGGRLREMGIRIALGGDRRGVLGLVLGQGLRLAGVGLGLGLLAAFGLTPFLRSQLFEVAPTDLTTFGLATAVLATAALAACLHPALRATRVEPVVVLREE